MNKRENRSALRAVPNRQHREAVAGPLTTATQPTEALIGPEGDGMAAWRYAIEPGAEVTGPNPAAGRGQYWVVTRGSLNHGQADLQKMSCAFVYPDEASFSAVAGPEGAEIIAMQFPTHASA